MGKIRFIFGMHNHQPVGNFDFVFEDNYQKSYKPLLNAFDKFPEFKFNIHYSGILLDWIEKNHPGHFEQLQRMVKRGQVEILSGGFYEPILSVIPERDAIGQIQKQTEYIHKNLEFNPRGIWMAERVWEPHLPYIMADAGIEYTVLDDTHFKYAGLKDEDLLKYYITEDEGKPARVFPINKNLRYTIPFQKIEVTLDYLKSLVSDDPNRVVVFADDGEKFGSWPGTYERVFEGKWLENFLEMIVKNSDWIETLHFSEALDTLEPAGPVYLPVASYAEMMEWTLPTDAFKNYIAFEEYLKEQDVYDKNDIFVRGGFWRNFLSKYTESNNMHKKMIYISEQLAKLKKYEKSDAYQKAKEHMWAAQCNCGYWHGVFGGLYLNHLRHAIYSNLIAAENIIEQFSSTNGLQKEFFKEIDYNLDGKKEILLQGEQMNLYLCPQRGGMAFQCDFKPKNFNIFDTFSRKEEGYHQKLRDMKKIQAKQKKSDDLASIHDLVLAKEDGLEKYLIYDQYEKKSFIDHFINGNTSLEDFRWNRFVEQGDFVEKAFKTIDISDTGTTLQVNMEREGIVKYKGKTHKIAVQKSFIMDKKEADLQVIVTLKNLELTPIEIDYAMEMNFGLLGGHSFDKYYASDDADIKGKELATTGELLNASHISMTDEFSGVHIDLRTDTSGVIHYFPVETISLSEAGFERVYQNSDIFFRWPVSLESEWNVKLSMKIKALH